jgi:hypothetical protein
MKLFRLASTSVGDQASAVGIDESLSAVLVRFGGDEGL